MIEAACDNLPEISVPEISVPELNAPEFIDETSNFTPPGCYSESEDLANPGLPLLNLKDRPYSFYEFWPAWVFYVPVTLYWIFLSFKYRHFGLPMLANPNIYLGGMVGESKTEILDSIVGDSARQNILDYCSVEITDAESESQA